MSGAMVLIGQIDTLYHHAVYGILVVVTIVGVLVPWLVSIQQSRPYKRSKKRLEKLESAMEERIPDALAEMDARLANTSAKLEQKTMRAGRGVCWSRCLIERPWKREREQSKPQESRLVCRHPT